jgi:hypothetical protein
MKYVTFNIVDNTYFYIQRLKYIEIVGDFRLDTNYCMIGTARNYRLLEFKNKYLIRKYFIIFYNFKKKKNE